MAAFEPAPGDERLSTAMLSDSLDECGLRSQVLQGRLAPVVAGSRAFGRAATARFAPGEHDEPEDPYGAAIDFIAGLGRGELVVFATAESDASAFWGELFSAAAIGAGVVGVLTDGNLRDTERIAALQFPAFSRSRRPIDYRRRMAMVESRTTVTIGGVRIADGDLVMADDDGAVVIPREREFEVLAAARLRASKESTVLAELLAGESLRAVWDRHRIL
ncbi:RraA family protein [Lacisediminihabitans profunda]|uniref:Putative 4-hydroxy-4-methyl-2-oxoglutarate aldolase n=1 Tax=Lacisediminihabitans profunda TaxID=2594790 RepID=A0A5C8USU3_9MICO|nr:RraA family protein [Lacisediminihabitans profunda]TXN30960.1 RraA family protein [Lacisediminihabitans profunda]